MEEFTLQWHITAACDQNCKHCYMHDSDTYASEVSNQLSTEQCLQIIDDFTELMKRWGLQGKINFTGGDPLLRDDFFRLAEYAREKDLKFGVLGNPYHVTNGIAKRLKKLGISYYQVSIDGKEGMHDGFRRSGSFKDTMKAIEMINSAEIRSAVMFTLSKANQNELLDVIDIMAEAGVDTFDFSRLVPMGSGKSMKSDMLSPAEFRGILLRVADKYNQLEMKGCKTHFGRKDPLWVLLQKELGILPAYDGDKICDGCSIGMSVLSILADGTVYACRRLPIEIGKLPEQRLLDIFIHSQSLNTMREHEKIKGCGSCDLLKVCRGCRAVSFGVFSDYFEKDPQCWKGVTT